MKTFKFKVGDSFMESNKFSYVISVTKEQLFTLITNIDKDGLSDGIFNFVQYNLTEKNDLRILSQIEKNFPETKFGQIGSKVIYDEDEFVLFAVKIVVFGTMSFKKPLLINTDKMMDAMEDVLLGADEFTDLKTTFDLNYPRFSKIPMESNKTLQIFEVAPPKFPIITVQKIEVEEEKEEAASLNLIPPLSNAFTGKRILTEPLKILQGFTLPFNENDTYNNGLPYTISGLGKYGKTYSTWLINGGRNNSTGRGNPVYILSENEKLFPDWKLKTDLFYPIGTKLRSNKNGLYEDSVIFKMLEIENTYENLFTMFGKFRANENDKQIPYLNHPQTYLGDNKFFEPRQTDLFLLLGKQPLSGTKKDGIDSIWYKSVGSSQFPLKTRSQLEKFYTRYPSTNVLESNLQSYEQNITMSPSNYFPKSFKDIIEEKNPDELVGDDFIFEKRGKKNYSWEAFKLLSENNLSTTVKTGKNEMVEKLMDYFDYDNLAILKENNPKLYEKISDLLSKSIQLYIENLPNKKLALSKSNSVEFLAMYIGQYRLFYPSTSVKNRKVYNVSIDIKKGGNTQLSMFQTTDDQQLDLLTKNLLTLIDDLVAKNYHADGMDFVLPLNSFYDTIEVVISLYKYAMSKLIIEDFEIVEFDPNIYATLYLSNFVAAYNYADFFNEYDKPFFSKLQFGQKRYYGSIVKQYEYDFNGIAILINIRDANDTIENRRIWTGEFAKLHYLVCDNFLLLKRFYHLGQFIKVFQYYDIVRKKIDVNFEDITNDIRFKYYLRMANLIGQFKETDFVYILKIFEQIRELALVTAKFSEIDEGNIDFLGWNFELDLFNFDPTKLNYRDSEEVRIKLIDDGFNVNKTNPLDTIKLILLEPKALIQYYKKITDSMKQNSSFKLLLEGTQTPQDMWLGIFGGGSLNVVLAEDEQIVEIESEDAPKVTIEEIEDIKSDDVNWDEIDPDEIDLALNDDEFDLDNLEIF